MTAEPAQFVPGRAGVFFPANRTAMRLASDRKKICLSSTDLVEIKMAGTAVTLINGQPITTEIIA